MVNASRYRTTSSRRAPRWPSWRQGSPDVATPARRWPCGPRTNAVARRAARTRNVAEFSPQSVPSAVTEGAVGNTIRPTVSLL